MQYFKTELTIPQTLRAAERNTYRRTVRYGHARLGRRVETAVLPSSTLVELPRVQAVVSAIGYSRAA